MHHVKRGLHLFGGLISLILLTTGILGSAAQPAATGTGPLGDYGDAPDQLSAGYAHANPQMIGSFPSTYSASSDPSYVLHRFPHERVYLGQTVTVEDNALVVDRDLDDGWLPGSFLTCSRAHLSVYVTVPRGATTGPIYLNVLFDWDHNGRWGDFSTCTTTTRQDRQAADEWAIRNLPLHQQPYSLTPGFSGAIELPKIITGPLEGELWVRLTISTEPVDERLFVPVAFGGHGWNGQGDFLYGETEDYFSCLLTSSESPLAGCPRPLGDQPPIDPPPSTSQNNAPIANDDTAVLSEDASVVIEVLSNDSDPDDDSLSIVDVTPPAHGSVTINPNSTVTYIPNPGFFGTDSFSYTICDTSGLCDTATVTITVEAINDPPVAEDDAVTMDEDSLITIDAIANDTDIDGVVDPSTVTIITGPANGSLTVNPDGTIGYTPDPNFNGNDTFTYQVCDQGSPVLCDTATVTITVNPVNDPPIANNDMSTTPEDTPININVLANDTDPDGQTLTVDSVTQPSHGTVTINPDGTVTYTPDANFNGTDTFTYTISDGNGGTDTAIVTITVTAVNDPPALTPIASQSVHEGQTLTLLVSCTDIDGPSLTLTASNLPAGATFTDNGDGTGTLTYSPGFDTVQHPNEQIVFSNISITCNDGSAADTDTFNLTVHDVNRPPDALNDSANTNEDTPVTIAVPANDSDPDGDTLTVISFSPAANGTVNCTASECTYTPNANFFGTDTFSYTISDGHGGIDTATVTITVNDNDDDDDGVEDDEDDCPGESEDHDGHEDDDGCPENEEPQADNLELTTPQDTPISGSLPVRDEDPGDTLTCILTQPAAHGTATVNADCTFTYVPHPGFTGEDEFRYQVSDGHSSDEGKVEITVTGTGDGWDKSSLTFISASKSCEGKTISATVKNVGSPMQGPTTWELYYSASGNPKKNGVLIASGTIPALAHDEEFTILMSVTEKGKYKFRAIQRPGHPGQGDLWSDTIAFDCD